MFADTASHSVSSLVLPSNEAVSSSSSCSEQIVGNLLYYRYMNPAIVAPDGFDIIDMSAGGQLHQDQRRNLGSVAKMLQHAAANKLFEGENAHMTPLNNFISQTYEKFRYEGVQFDSKNTPCSLCKVFNLFSF